MVCLFREGGGAKKEGGGRGREREGGGVFSNEIMLNNELLNGRPYYLIGYQAYKGSF